MSEYNKKWRCVTLCWKY